MEDSGETVNLAVLDQSDHQAIIIDQVQCTQLMRMSAPIGGKLPMHASGAGKAFLAQLSEEQVTSLLHRKGLHAYTHATLVSPLHLKEDLAQTRKRGTLSMMRARSACAASPPAFTMNIANRSRQSPSQAPSRV